MSRGGVKQDSAIDPVYITFDLHNIRAPVENVVALYEKIEQLPVLVPLLFDKVEMVSSCENRKTLVISLKIPVVNIAFKMTTELVLIKKREGSFILKGTATVGDGSISIEGHALIYTVGGGTSCFSQCKIASCPFDIFIVKLIYNFINPLAPYLMAFAANTAK